MVGWAKSSEEIDKLDDGAVLELLHALLGEHHMQHAISDLHSHQIWLVTHIRTSDAQTLKQNERKRLQDSHTNKEKKKKENKENKENKEDKEDKEDEEDKRTRGQEDNGEPRRYGNRSGIKGKELNKE